MSDELEWRQAVIKDIRMLADRTYKMKVALAFSIIGLLVSTITLISIILFK